ncbi:MAG: SBBP repeat-containing protein [Thermodesulfobacteriota bacterium]
MNGIDQKLVDKALTAISGAVVLLLCGALPGGASAATVTEEWAVRYNGSGNSSDAAYAMAVDGEGNVYVTGYSYSDTDSDYATVKYDADGIKLWEARYDGPGNYSQEYAYALAVDSAGNVYVTGESYGEGTMRDYATIKYDADGTELWVARYNGPGNGWDVAYALAVDSAGNVYVTGKSYGIGYMTGYDYATVKYDANTGTELWVARYTGLGSYFDSAYALAVDSAGDVYVTGESYDGTVYNYATVKYAAADGTQLWVARYRKGSASALAVDGAGSVYVTGRSYGDYTTIKYDADYGVAQWVVRYRGSASALAVDGAGSIYVTGTSYGDYTTIKYAPNGTQQWVSRYDGPGGYPDTASAMALDGAGNVYVTGRSSGTGGVTRNDGYDYATVKYDPNTGDELWVSRYDGPGPGDYYDAAHALAVDGSGNVHVTGTSYDESTGYDYATIKYSQPKDQDGDGVSDDADNCPATPNADQVDMDDDGIGDVCDDSDGDDLFDSVDVCPYENPTSFDADHDGCIDGFSGLKDMVDALVAAEVIAPKLGNSLLRKIANAEKSADKGEVCAAISHIEAFVNEINAQTGKKVVAGDEVNGLIAYAGSVISYLQSLFPTGESC